MPARLLRMPPPRSRPVPPVVPVWPVVLWVGGLVVALAAVLWSWLA